MERNYKFLIIYPLPTLLTLLLLLKKLLVLLMKQLKVLTNPQEISLLVFFISFVTVSVTPSINTPESCNDFMILITSFISSFKINKVNPFPPRTSPFPLIFYFIPTYFITFEVKLFTNPGKLSLDKRITIFVTAFFPPNQEPKDPPDLIILDIWALLSLISVHILLAKTFLILVVCLLVTNNSCGNTSSSKFFLFNFNIVSFLFFAVDFNLF